MKAKVLLSTAAVLALTAIPAQAQFKDFSFRCSPGVLRSCASIQVFTSLFGSGTNVTIRVRNLQGGYWADNGGASLIQRIGLTAPNIAGASGLSVWGSGAATATGSPASFWSLHANGVPGVGGPIELSAVVGNNLEGGIVGCAGYAVSNFFQTCGAGWVNFSFFTTNKWNATQSEIAWLTYNSPNLNHECGSVGVPGIRDQCDMVTPEPVSMVLLGTGLAGLGSAGIARRRKQNGDVTNA